MISFFLNFEPDIPTMTHQVGLRAGVNKMNKPYLYKDREYRSLEHLFKSKLEKFSPDVPFDENIVLQTLWVFRSDNKGVSYRNDKPDTDNLVKGFKDAMTKSGFWKKDEHVVREITEKVDASSEYKHGVYVWIKTITSTELATATLASTLFRNQSTSEGSRSEDVPLT